MGRTGFAAREGALMGFEGREAVGYDHGYDGEVFCLGLALDQAYVEGFVGGCLERIGEEAPGARTFCGTSGRGGQGGGPRDPQGRVRGPPWPARAACLAGVACTACAGLPGAPRSRPVLPGRTGI